MSENKIIINGEEFPVNYLLLQAIADNLPELDTYDGLAHALVKLNIPSITSALLESERVDSKDWSDIWASGNLHLRRKLMQHSFQLNLNDEQAQDVMKMDDREILMKVAKNVRGYIPRENEVYWTPKMSEEMARKLMNYVRNYPDPLVRAAYECTESSVDDEEDVDEDGVEFTLVKPASFELKDMTVEDLKKLSSLSLNELRYIAFNLNRIPNINLRNDVANFILVYPDPSVRFQLTEDYHTPISALKKLQNDPDGDIAAAATYALQTLENLSPK